MHNSETPLSCLALFEGGPCLIADANFDVLMVKLKSHFQNAKGHKVESRGSRYRYCDFLIKVGTVTMSSSARGISVEVCVYMYICCDKDESRPSAFSPWGVNSWLASSGGILPLCRSWGLLEPHEGVYAVLSRPQRPWTAICVCCQAWGTLCTNRLCWHHDSVPGVIQQTAQAANPWNQCALSLQQRYVFFSLHVCTDVGIFLVLWISIGTQAFFFERLGFYYHCRTSH